MGPTEIVWSSTAFQNAFWLFLGIVAGALIQHVLGAFSRRSQAKLALKVVQTEIAYNRDEVEAFRERISWLNTRIAAGQIGEQDLFLPMQKFDYSSIGPLTNTGYFHALLGHRNVRKYLEFYHFFRIENGNQLTVMLRQEHREGRSLQFLEWVEKEAVSKLDSLAELENSRLALIQLKLVSQSDSNRSKP